MFVVRIRGPFGPAPSSQKCLVPRKAALFDNMSTHQRAKFYAVLFRIPSVYLIFPRYPLDAHPRDQRFDFRFLGRGDDVHAVALASCQAQACSENMPNPSI